MGPVEQGILREAKGSLLRQFFLQPVLNRPGRPADIVVSFNIRFLVDRPAFLLKNESIFSVSGTEQIGDRPRLGDLSRLVVEEVGASVQHQGLRFVDPGAGQQAEQPAVVRRQCVEPMIDIEPSASR